MDPLEKRQLGSTGLAVTRIGLGCASIGGLFGDIDDDQAVEVVRRALYLGVNLFDTAPLYGAGRSETRLGKALQGVPRDQYVLCTKVGRVLDVDPDADTPISRDGYPSLKAVFDFSRDGILRSIEESLHRLQADRIDVLHIHDPDNHYDAAIGQAYPVLQQLREEGVIRGVSAGMNQWEMLARFGRDGDFDCFLLAGRYSLLEQGALDELLPLCVERNIGILAGGTYNTGILAQGARAGARYNYRQAPPEIVERARRIETVAASHAVDVKAAASQFVLAHPAVAAIIPGTRRPERVEENVAAIGAPIPADFWAELKGEGLLPDVAPVPE